MNPMTRARLCMYIDPWMLRTRIMAAATVNLKVFETGDTTFKSEGEAIEHGVIAGIASVAYPESKWKSLRNFDVPHHKFLIAGAYFIRNFKLYAILGVLSWLGLCSIVYAMLTINNPMTWMAVTTFYAFLAAKATVRYTDSNGRGSDVVFYWVWAFLCLFIGFIQ